jgi:hypothetical protein
MRDMKVVRLVRKEVERLDPALQGRETVDDYRAGVVLLAAVWVTGTDINRLIAFTGYDRDFVGAISLRMHKAGLWEGCGTAWDRAQSDNLCEGVDQPCTVSSDNFMTPSPSMPAFVSSRDIRRSNIE